MNRREWNAALSMIVALLLSCPTSGCGGTEAGNPSVADPAAPSNMQNIFANRFLDAMCVRLTGCYPSLSTAQCQSGMLLTTNLGQALGAPASYLTFQSVVDGESTGNLVPRAPASTQCVSDIQALACDGLVLQGAYSPADPSNFSNVVNMVPNGLSSCRGVY